MAANLDMPVSEEMNMDLDLPGSEEEDFRSALQLPWLVLAQHSPDCLEFSIPSDSEGKVIKLDLPRKNQGRFHSSSKGWLIMVKEETSQIFLLNPISGDKHKLPYLCEIPSFKKFEGRNPDCYRRPFSSGIPSVDKFGGRKTNGFLREIAISSSNISECTVAAIFWTGEIGVCRPGEKSWTIFPVLDDKKESPLCLLFSSSGMLYVLVKNDEIENGDVATRTLRFEDGDELQLKLVHDKKEKSRKDSFNCWGPNAFLQVIVEDKSCLIESVTNNEVLLIHQIKNREVTDCRGITRTLDFLVYKIDPENDRSFIEVKSLGNQILFVSSRGCSLSFPVSNSKRLKANCIHFVELGVKQSLFGLDEPSGTGTSRVFCLDCRKSQESANSTLWGLSWWSPRS